MFSQPTKLKGKPTELPFPLCFLNKHAPDRSAVKWDGRHFTGHCLHCGKHIRRKARKTWKLDWMRKTKG